MIWTLKYWSAIGADPVTKTLDAWGATACVLTLQSCDLDTMALSTPELADADPQWAVDGNLELWSQEGEAAAVRRFFGRVVEAEPSASGDKEGWSYTVAGPWWYAQQFPFQQSWAIFGGDTTFNFPRALLFDTSTTADVIAEAVGIVVASSVPASGYTLITMTAGTIDAAMRPPRDKVSDMKCAQVILKCLRFMPDAVFWFDYSGATNTAPIFHCRRAADLDGVAVPFGADDIVVARSAAQKLRYVRIVLKIQEAADDEFHTVAPAIAVYPVGYGAGLNEHQLGGIDVALDYETGVMDGTLAQEICQKVYDAAQATEWRGQGTFTEDEPNLEVRPGKTLTVTGGKVDWETMDALVQTARHDLMAGRTEVSYGPPLQMGPADLAEMLRAWRNRRAFRDAEKDEQTTAESDSQNFGFDKPDETTHLPAGVELRTVSVLGSGTEMTMDVLGKTPIPV